MAKKRKRKDKQARQRKQNAKLQRQKKKRKAQPTGGGFDVSFEQGRRAVERAMFGFLPNGDDCDTPGCEAQELMYEAFELDDPIEKCEIALAALEISPDCSDAYNVLAENAPSLEDALAVYQQGVAAGERAIGPEGFAEDEGHFWGILETRPYMRSKLGLAQCLSALGRADEAVQHYRDMLRLNPGDNQGIRYVLSTYLLDQDWDDELRELLKQYEDDGSANWAYHRVLLAFRAGGDGSESRDMLTTALKVNTHVPGYLLGSSPLPDEPPSYVSPGNEDEAVGYVMDSMSAWRNTPGAMSWLREAAGVSIALPEPPRAKRRGDQERQMLAALPQTDESVWQVDARPMGPRIFADGESIQPWMIFIGDRVDRQIRHIVPVDKRPSTADVWESLVEAMRMPAEGDPMRPAVIEVRLKSYRDAWLSRLERIGVQCLQVERFEDIDAMLKEFGKSGNPQGAGQDDKEKKGDAALFHKMSCVPFLFRSLG